MHESTTHTVAAVLMLRRDGAALLQHRDNKPNLRHAGMWVPPGGHAEPGEARLACARREVLEETGYAASKLRLLFSFEDATAEGPIYQLTVFWCLYDGLQPITCYEGQAVAFIERREIVKYAIPQF